MFELPEYVTLAKQMNETLQGKTIRSEQLGNSHKFVWYNRSHEASSRLTQGKRIGAARAKSDRLRPTRLMLRKGPV